MGAFCSVLDDYKLSDIGYSGLWFTWERGNHPETNIRERLNRAIANDEWRGLFPLVKVRYLSHFFFDHCPLLVDTAEGINSSKPRRFLYDAWWAMEEDFGKELARIWVDLSDSVPVKLQKLGERLMIWSSHSRFMKNKKCIV